jgi:hypothetical protein
MRAGVTVHEPEFNAVIPLVALISAVCLHDGVALISADCLHDLVALISAVCFHDLVNSNGSVFWEVLLKLRKFCQPYDNFGDKNDNFL